MSCLPISNGILCFSNIEFNCPYCKKGYNDCDDKYVDKCNKNKGGYTKIKCSCGKIFGMTYNYKGDAVSFELGYREHQKKCSELGAQKLADYRDNQLVDKYIKK